MSERNRTKVLIGTAGHIDHGKSSLVRALTGIDPDRLPEEKARGITIDLGFAHSSWDGIEFSFVDVPGHERLVRTMVAGASGIDAALFVVASDDGVMPQTREHLDILCFLGITGGVVARTKSDLVDAETGQLADEEIRDLLRGTFLEKAPIIPVSPVTGAGIALLRSALTKAVRELPKKTGEKKVTRLFIDRVFSVKGFGPVVTGTLTGGAIRPEDHLTLFPPGQDVRVRRMEVHGTERSEALEGERTSLNLAGVQLEELARGQCVFAAGALVPSRLLTVTLTLLPSQPRNLEHGTQIRFHHGTAETGGRILLAPLEGVSRTSEMEPGETRAVQILLESEAAVMRNDRFILRRPSPMETLGGGRVLDALMKRATKKEPLTLLTVRTLETGSDKDVASLFIALSGPRGITRHELAARLGLPFSEAARTVESLVTAGTCLALTAAVAVPHESLSRMAETAHRILEAHRKGGAPSPFMPRGEFLQRFGLGLPAQAAEAWLTRLLDGRKIVAERDQIGPPGVGSAAVKQELSGFSAEIAEAYRLAGFDPPKVPDLAKTLRTKPGVVDGLVSHLMRQAVLIRLSPDVIVHRDAVASAAARLIPHKGKQMAIAELRDILGLSRKYLIPLLEHFDRQKTTRRAGDQRVIE